MILVSFFSEEDALADEANRCYTVILQSAENVPFLFLGGHPVFLQKLDGYWSLAPEIFLCVFRVHVWSIHLLSQLLHQLVGFDLVVDGPHREDHDDDHDDASDGDQDYLTQGQPAIQISHNCGGWL